MKKLLVLMLVLGLANAASAVVDFDTYSDGSSDPRTATAGDVISIDIYATGAADYLMGTGELLITITGPAQFAADALDNLAYKEAPLFWYPLAGLAVNSAIDDATNARVSAAAMTPTTMFFLPMPDYPISNILVTYLGGGTATVTIVPNNAPNEWGNAGYYVDGIAYTDLEATGGSIDIIPEPATIALLGLGGLALLRRRRK